MLSVAEARARIVAAFHPLGSEQVGLLSALGRVLASDVAARVTQPPAAVSAMDGYAVRADDVAKVPDLPPDLCRRRTSEITMPRSTALHMS